MRPAAPLSALFGPARLRPVFLSSSGDARKTWIMQINAGAREYKMRYSQLIHGIGLANIGLNRKVLSQLAIQEPYSFRAVIHEAQAAIGRRASAAASAASK